MIALNANYEQYKQLKRIVEQRIKIKRKQFFVLYRGQQVTLLTKFQFVMWARVYHRITLVRDVVHAQIPGYQLCISISDWAL